MNPPGMNQLLHRVPDLNSPLGRLKVGLYALAWLALVTAYFTLTDRIPTWSIDSQIIIFALVIAFVVFFFRIIPGSFVPAEDQGYLISALMLPDGAAPTQTGPAPPPLSVPEAPKTN